MIPCAMVSSHAGSWQLMEVKLGLCLCWLVQLFSERCWFSWDDKSEEVGKIWAWLETKKYKQGGKRLWTEQTMGKQPQAGGFGTQHFHLWRRKRGSKVPSQRILEQAQPQLWRELVAGCPRLVSKNRLQCRHRWQILKWGWFCRCCPCSATPLVWLGGCPWELPHDH